MSGPNLVYGFLGHLMVHPQKEKIVSYLLLILLSGPRRGGGRCSNCNMKFWIVKWENVNENGPAGIEVVRVFCPNLVCSCFGPQVVNLWKGLPRLVWYWPYTTWPVVCRIVNWMGLTAYNVASPLKIWTKFGVCLPRRLCGPPSKEENCVVSIIFFIEWTAKGVEVGWIANWNFEWWNERTWMKAAPLE